jgi:proteic killer suppression protein
VITSFWCAETERVSKRERGTKFSNIESVALRKLTLLNAAANLNDLRVPPGNRLEALKGDRAGQHSVRINDQWRICFVWEESGPKNVEIVDYH